jgi:hypothetical protein
MGGDDCRVQIVDFRFRNAEVRQLGGEQPACGKLFYHSSSLYNWVALLGAR